MSKYTDIDDAIGKGHLVLLPTETVYGLAVDPASEDAIDRVYTAKGRRFDKPLALCVRDIEQAEIFGHLNDLSRALMKRFWPGALSLIVPVKENSGLDDRVTGVNAAGERTVSLRCPDINWRKKLNCLPLALTSANRSTYPDPITYREAAFSMGKYVEASLETSLAGGGKPSTVLALDGRRGTLLREGDITRRDLFDFDIEWTE